MPPPTRGVTLGKVRVGHPVHGCFTDREIALGSLKTVSIYWVHWTTTLEQCEPAKPGVYTNNIETVAASWPGPQSLSVSCCSLGDLSWVGYRKLGIVSLATGALGGPTPHTTPPPPPSTPHTNLSLAGSSNPSFSFFVKPQPQKTFCSKFLTID